MRRNLPFKPVCLPAVLLLGFIVAGCRSSAPAARQVGGGDDLVGQARAWRAQHGLAEARDRVSDALLKLDAKNGWLEQRVWQANADKHRTWPNSLATLPREERARTGIFLVLGYRTKQGRSEPVIRHGAEYLRQQGWHAMLIESIERGTGEQNAAAVQAVLAEQLPHVDRAVLVGFSKGGLDLVHWYAREAEKLPAAQRRKIKLSVFFAAALRGAAVAEWIVDGSSLGPAVMRHQLRTPGNEALADVRSTGTDPWATGAVPPLQKLTPGLRSISFVGVPECRDGLTRCDPQFARLARFAAMDWCWLGPVDGLVESAAQVLPPQAGVPQHIVRVHGSHALLDGHYLNGRVVSKIYRARGKDYWLGGEEMLDDLLRALPRSWIN